MSKLTTRTRNKKSLSKFQKLWQRIERLKSDIERRDQKLDQLAERVRQEVHPVEMAAVSANVELLHRLLDLGQRKSWSNWQRQELERWIRENLDFAAAAQLLDDDLRNAVARYDAFRMGVELDENDGRSPGEQLDDIIEQHAQEREQHRAESEEVRAQMREAIERSIDVTLQEEFGPRPERQDRQKNDPFEEHLDAELAQHQAEYDRQYAQAKARLEAEAQAQFSELYDQEDPEGWDFDPEELDREFEAANDNPFKLDNATIQRMFRSAAAALHPDREPDPSKHPEKQKLMVELLAARKSGDVITLLSLYQQHVEHGEALSKEQERTLIGALQQQIAQLEDQYKYYTPSSLFHESAFDFYSPSNKTIEKNIAEHLEFIDRQEKGTRKMARGLNSMSKLKPLLEERYNRRRQREIDAHFAHFSDLYGPPDVS